MSGLAVCPDDIWNYFENDLEEDKKDEFLRDNAEFNQNNNNQKYE